MDTAEALKAENAAFAELLADADLSRPVPTCPEWTLRQLMVHVGRGDRWCAHIVAERSSEDIDPRTVPDGKPPAELDEQTAWLHAGVRTLLDAVESVGPETPVWTFLGPRPARWWIRRRLHETVVHRADAALAVGSPFEVDPAVAADSVTEHLERVAARAKRQGVRPLDPGRTLHLHATDPGLGQAGEWTIHGGPGGAQEIAFDHAHGKATAALRGPVRDLLLAIVRRGNAADLGLEIFGDQAVWDTWLARTPF